MRCAECREQVSARLDDEADPALAGAVDAHLASCAACREWQEGAARVTRMARVTVAQQTPDVTAAVLLKAPRARTGPVRLALRMLLALLAVGQIVLGLAHVDGALAAPAVATHTAGATPAHFTHEFAAFTIAVGIGFAWVAWRTSRAPGLVPTLATFVLLLIVLEIVDLARGYAEYPRLVSHSLVLAGLVVVLVLTTRRLGGGGLFPQMRRRAGDDDAAAPPFSDERGRPGRRGSDGRMRPSAHHDAA